MYMTTMSRVYFGRINARYLCIGAVPKLPAGQPSFFCAEDSLLEDGLCCLGHILFPLCHVKPSLPLFSPRLAKAGAILAVENNTGM